MKRTTILLLAFSLASGIFSQEQFDKLFLARSMFDRGMLEDVIQLVDGSSEKEDDYRYQLLKGEAFLKIADYDMAISSFNDANMLLEDSGELGLARVYALLNDPKTSVFHLERHLKSAERAPQRDLLLNRDLQSIDESSEWITLWKRNWYTQLEQGVAEVEYLVERNRIEDAKSMAKSFSGLYSDRAEVDYINGYLALLENNYDRALLLLNRSIDKDQDLPVVWEKYIEALMAAGDYTGAVAASGRAIGLFPDRLDFYIDRAESLRKSGEREKALANVSVLLEYYPGNEELTGMAGKIAYETRNYNQALKYLSDNIDSHPGSPEHFTARGDVYLSTRTWEFAIVDYSMALDLDPYNGDVYFKKASALIETGNITDACHDLKMAMKLGNRKASALISRHCIE